MFTEFVAGHLFVAFRIRLEDDGGCILVRYIQISIGEDHRAPIVSAAGAIRPEDFARLGFQTFDGAGAGIRSKNMLADKNAGADALWILFDSPNAIGLGDIAAAAELEADRRAVESAGGDAEVA